MSPTCAEREFGSKVLPPDRATTGDNQASMATLPDRGPS